jgi:hypothetical protein
MKAVNIRGMSWMERVSFSRRGHFPHYTVHYLIKKYHRRQFSQHNEFDTKNVLVGVYKWEEYYWSTEGGVPLLPLMYSANGTFATWKTDGVTLGRMPWNDSQTGLLAALRTIPLMARYYNDLWMKPRTVAG